MKEHAFIIFFAGEGVCQVWMRRGGEAVEICPVCSVEAAWNCRGGPSAEEESRIPPPVTRTYFLQIG